MANNLLSILENDKKTQFDLIYLSTNQQNPLLINSIILKSNNSLTSNKFNQIQRKQKEIFIPKILIVMASIIPVLSYKTLQNYLDEKVRISIAPITISIEEQSILKIVCELKNENDIHEQFQMISEQLLSEDDQQIDIRLTVEIDSEQCLLLFNNVFKQLAPSIKFISLKFCNHNYSTQSGNQQFQNTIAECVSHLVAAYKIELSLGCLCSTENGAYSLSASLRKLTNLKDITINYFKCQCRQDKQEIKDRISNLGYTAINEAINSLNNLAIVKYDHFIHISSELLPNLSILTLQLTPILIEASAFIQFKSETKRMKNQLISVSIKQCQGITFSSTYLSNKQILNHKPFILRVIDHCFTLPYLTEFSNDTLIKRNSLSEQSQSLFFQFLRSKRIKINHLVLFQRYITPFLTMNPKFVALDLDF